MLLAHPTCHLLGPPLIAAAALHPDPAAAPQWLLDAQQVWLTPQDGRQRYVPVPKFSCEPRSAVSRRGHRVLRGRLCCCAVRSFFGRPCKTPRLVRRRCGPPLRFTRLGISSSRRHLPSDRTGSVSREPRHQRAHALPAMVQVVWTHSVPPDERSRYWFNRDSADCAARFQAAYLPPLPATVAAASSWAREFG